MSENGETLPIVIRNKTKQSDSDITKQVITRPWEL